MVRSRRTLEKDTRFSEIENKEGGLERWFVFYGQFLAPPSWTLGRPLINLLDSGWLGEVSKK